MRTGKALYKECRDRPLCSDEDSEFIFLLQDGGWFAIVRGQRCVVAGGLRGGALAPSYSSRCSRGTCS